MVSQLNIISISMYYFGPSFCKYEGSSSKLFSTYNSPWTILPKLWIFQIGNTVRLQPVMTLQFKLK